MEKNGIGAVVTVRNRRRGAWRWDGESAMADRRG